MKITKAKISQIYEEHKVNIRVCCNEYHSHSVLKGCLDGPKESIDVCYLYEYILILENRLTNIRSIADTNNI